MSSVRPSTPCPGIHLDQTTHEQQSARNVPVRDFFQTPSCSRLKFKFTRCVRTSCLQTMDGSTRPNSVEERVTRFKFFVNTICRVPTTSLSARAIVVCLLHGVQWQVPVRQWLPQMKVATEWSAFFWHQFSVRSALILCKDCVSCDLGDGNGQHTHKGNGNGATQRHQCRQYQWR